MVKSRLSQFTATSVVLFTALTEFFFALPPRALKEKQFELSFTVHFNRNGGGQFHDVFAFSLLALYKCKQNVNLPKRNFMYELI